MLRRIAAGGGVASRALAALLVTTGALAAVAYAATGPGRVEGGGAASASRWQGPQGIAGRSGRGRPPRPSITRHPRKMSTSSSARFAFSAARGTPRFRCRLDDVGWRACRSPASFHGLRIGDHSFAVRAVGASGRQGLATRFLWKRVEPKPFSIEPRLSSLGALYPGAPAQPLPVVLRNPNPVLILITALWVSVSTDPAGCDSDTNVALAPSSVSPRQPLAVPAGGAVSLPSASVSAPSIALRDLPANQDACRGAQLPLAFAGEAHG
jgi:hypothetical protein